MIKVFGWYVNRAGAGQDRIIRPMKELDKLDDWEAVSGDTFSVGEMMDYDLVVAQQISHRGALTTWKYLCDPDAPASVYETDDNILAVENTNYGAYEFFGNPIIQQFMKTAMWYADAITTPSIPLGEILAEFNNKVYHIPTYLPERLLQSPRQPNKNVVVIYGAGSTHWVDAQRAAPFLEKFFGSHPNYIFRNYGQDFRGIINVDNYDYRAWEDDRESYVENLRGDIGLCLLADTEFNRCKTAIKAVEYAFRGIPTIADNVTPYKEYIIDGETGFLVNSPDEWLEALETLASNPDLRYKMGMKAYQYAQEQTMELNINKYTETYKHIIANDHERREEKLELMKSKTPAAEHDRLYIPERYKA